MTSTARDRLAALAKADKARGAGAKPKKAPAPTEPEPRLTSIAVPPALLSRLRRLAFERTEATGERCAPWRLIVEALDAVDKRREKSG